MESTGYVHMISQPHGSLNPKSNKYIFIWYHEGSKCYLMLDERVCIGFTKIESCYVDFLKTIFLVGVEYESLLNIWSGRCSRNFLHNLFLKVGNHVLRFTLMIQWSPRMIISNCSIVGVMSYKLLYYIEASVKFLSFFWDWRRPFMCA